MRLVRSLGRAAAFYSAAWLVIIQVKDMGLVATVIISFVLGLGASIGWMEEG